MKKQKKLTAMIASLAMIAVTATSLGTATYAWFTRGTEAAASGFDFTASAASGIQISTDAETWRSSIAASDFTTVLETGGVQEGNRITVDGMDPVSTIDSVTGGLFSFYEATSGDGNFSLAANTEDYLVFDLYFLNQGAEDLTLSLTSASTVIDGATDQDTSLSTRVAFVIEGSNNDPAVVTGLSNGTTAYIWEPNSLTRSDSALASGATNNAKYNYNGIANNNGGTPVDTIDAYGILESGAYTTLVNATKDIAIGDSPIVGTLPGATGGQITKVKVFVWMEGQDVDCNNGTSAGDVTIALGFDSGATSTTLGTKTASTIVADALTVTGAGNLGANYAAYVFLEETDTTVSLDYRLFITSGTAQYETIDVTSITLGSVVTAETYSVVVVAQLDGAIGSRSDAPIIVS